MTDGVGAEGATLPRRGARALLAGNLVAQACALGRYMALARLLGPEELGLSVLLILTVQFFESITDSGSDRFLIQDRDGDAPRMQAVVQLVAVARGLLVAALLLVAAGPVAAWYGQPALAGALMALAVAPALAGFLHFDTRRAQRRNDFAREGWMLMASEAASLLVTVAAALWFRDHRAAVAGLVARAAATALASHLLAERRYRIGWTAELGSRLFRFAAPLAANGLLLFLASQGDRILVGRTLGVAELGRYSVVLLMIYFPSAFLLRFTHTMWMPVVARARGTPDGTRRVLDEVGGQALLLSLAMAAGFAVVAPFAAPLLFGSAFAQPAALVALIGVLQVARFVVIWPTTAALAHGLSGVVLRINFLRLVTFPLALGGWWWVGGLPGLLGGIAAGELAAAAAAVRMANRALGRPALLDFGRVAALVGGSAAIVGAAAAVGTGRLGITLAGVAGATMVLAVVAWRERRVICRFATRPARLIGLDLS